MDKDHKRTPLRFAVLKCLSDFRLTIGADAYSGAPVTASNRVPVWLSPPRLPVACCLDLRRETQRQGRQERGDLQLGYFLFKEQTVTLLSGRQTKCKQK